MLAIVLVVFERWNLREKKTIIMLGTESNILASLTNLWSWRGEQQVKPASSSRRWYQCCPHGRWSCWSLLVSLVIRWVLPRNKARKFTRNIHDSNSSLILFHSDWMCLTVCVPVLPCVVCVCALTACRTLVFSSFWKALQKRPFGLFCATCCYSAITPSWVLS